MTQDEHQRICNRMAEIARETQDTARTFGFDAEITLPDPRTGEVRRIEISAMTGVELAFALRRVLEGKA